MSKLTFATRPSELARWQTRHIIDLLQQAWPELVCEEILITTQGDHIIDRPLPEIGGKGLFTQELEAELIAGNVDAAVHSLKDLPIEDTPGLSIGLIPARANPQDVLISADGATLENLPDGAVIGTSSLRRQAQLLAFRPDVQVKPIRGNVDTRIRKVFEGQYDAAILAAAGVNRLGLDEHIAEYLPLEVMLPAPGQGALAVQCRSGDKHVLNFFSPLASPATCLAVTAERAFLLALGGGCSLPVGAYASVQAKSITLQGVVASDDGKRVIRVSGQGHDPRELAARLASEAVSQGAGEILHV
jgi:hydroxymethylbilane synthase